MLIRPAIFSTAIRTIGLALLDLSLIRITHRLPFGADAFGITIITCAAHAIATRRSCTPGIVLTSHNTRIIFALSPRCAINALGFAANHRARVLSACCGFPFTILAVFSGCVIAICGARNTAARGNAIILFALFAILAGRNICPIIVFAFLNNIALTALLSVLAIMLYALRLSLFDFAMCTSLAFGFLIFAILTS